MIMETVTKDISIKMVKEKALEYLLLKVVRSKLENGSTINYIIPARFTTQVATVIGGNGRITRGKDMEQVSLLMETDTSGNGCRMTCTAMEYSDGQMEEYTMDNGNKIIWMAMDTRGGQVAKNTMVSSKIIGWMEREFYKRKANYSVSKSNKTSL
jgi:hypothetical protein